MARNDPHRYQTCRDPDCARIACLAYKSGYDDGYADGASAAADG